MNREQWKERLSLIQAFVDGKEVELKVCGQWMRINASPDFNSKLEDYRIKPEPKLRPWKPEEVPVAGFLIRFEKESTISASYLVIARDLHGVIVSNTSSFEPSLSKYSHEKLLTYEYSTDHGKTWLPCGVEES
jgi:hypothetical protein